MAFNDSWLYHYGWKILSEQDINLKNIINNKILDISRFFNHSGMKNDIMDFFLSHYSDDMHDFIAFQYGMLMLHLDNITPSFLDDRHRFQLHYSPDFTNEMFDKVKREQLSVVQPDMVFSASKHPEYTNDTIQNMIGKTIEKVQILKLKAEDLWQEPYPRLGGLRLTLSDNSEVYIGTQLRLLEDNSDYSYLCVLSPDQVNFSRIEQIIEVQ